VGCMRRWVIGLLTSARNDDPDAASDQPTPRPPTTHEDPGPSAEVESCPSAAEGDGASEQDSHAPRGDDALRTETSERGHPGPVLEASPPLTVRPAQREATPLVSDVMSGAEHPALACDFGNACRGAVVVRAGTRRGISHARLACRFHQVRA
jgi:hypothetical protein